MVFTRDEGTATVILVGEGWTKWPISDDGVNSNMNTHNVPRNFIQVSEIDTSINSFKKAGGNEVMGTEEVPNVGFTFLDVDPEGNVIGLHQPTPRPRPASSKSKRSRK